MKNENENENENEMTEVVETKNNGVSPLVAMLASGQLKAEHVQQAMELQKAHDEYEAKKAYHMAMAKAKAEMGVAVKGKVNTFCGSKYADLSALITAAGPALSKYGFNWSWKIDSSEKGYITANCQMTHELGHSEIFPCRLPDAISIVSKEGRAVNNPAQAAGSARTYAKRYSFEDAVGIASQDDDGQAATIVKVPMMTEEDMSKLKHTCEECGKDYEKYLSFISKKRPLFNGLLQAPKSELEGMIAQIKKSAKKDDTSE